jgi:hypothetical protein
LFVCCLFGRRAVAMIVTRLQGAGPFVVCSLRLATPVAKICSPPIAQGCLANFVKNSSKLGMMRFGV